MSALAENFGNFVSSIMGDKKPKTTVTPQDTPNVHPIPWGQAAFPEDGSGRSIKIYSGEALHFRPIDDLPHNVAEADVLKKNKWLPARDRKLNINCRTAQNFDHTIVFPEEGTYYLVCPIDGHHEVMRLKVVVLSNQKPEKTEKPKMAAPKTEDVKEQFDHHYQNATAAVKKFQEKMNDETHSVAQKALDNLQQYFNQHIKDFSQGDKTIITNLMGQLRQAVVQKVRPMLPMNMGRLGTLDMLAGTGIMQGKPTFSFSQLNFMDQKNVVGPLGPAVKKSQKAVTKPAVPVQPFNPMTMEDDDEIIVKAEAKPRRKHYRDQKGCEMKCDKMHCEKGCEMMCEKDCMDMSCSDMSCSDM